MRSQVTEKFVETLFNGDGIMPAETASGRRHQGGHQRHHRLPRRGDRPQRQARRQPGQGGSVLRRGPGLSDWQKKAESDAAVLPLGEATLAAAAAVRAVKAKVDDYFTRCRLAAFDPRAVNALNREEKEYLALAAKDLTDTHAEIAGFPLARVEAGRPLPLTQGVNPAWADALAKLTADAVKPSARRQDLPHRSRMGRTAGQTGPV